MNEIAELLALRASPSTHCDDICRRVDAKIENVDEKIRRLRAMRKSLSKLASRCPGEGPLSECPILELLDMEKGE